MDLRANCSIAASILLGFDHYLVISDFVSFQ